MQQIHLIKRLKNAACTCRSSLPTCASCWESHLPRGAAADTLRGMLGPCSWRERVGQVSGQTASPTSSSWTASITERGAWRESQRWRSTEENIKKNRHISLIVSLYQQLLAHYHSDHPLIEWVTCRLRHFRGGLGLLGFIFLHVEKGKWWSIHELI